MYLYEKLQVAIIDDELDKETPEGRAFRALIRTLRSVDIEVTELCSFEDALQSVLRSPELDALIVDWDRNTPSNRGLARELILGIRKRNHEIPIFLSAHPDAIGALTLDIERIVAEYFWILEDTTDFIAGRIDAAARRYRDRLLPPFFNSLVNFADDFEYSWHTPGHTGGTAFLKSPAGRIFHEFFGEELFRSDLSVSVGELGSLLDHSGTIGEGERFAAKIFGADRTYYVTNGTSTANKIIFMACATDGDTVFIDRNCHKSMEHAAILTGARPVWMRPERNRYGIIGPILPGEMSAETLRAKIRSSRIITGKDAPAVYAIVTNSTYDGLCYNASRVEELLGNQVPRLHFDEAWYAYARFNPIYRDRFGMREGKHRPEGPTVYASQSTHKLLAALSQASMIHVRDGREPADHARFNESFMMHTSTSPLYAILAACDVSAKMMEGPMGRALTDECIQEAVFFRKSIVRLGEKLMQDTPGDWWFSVWQPEFVRDSDGGQKLRFADVPDARLASDPSCWILEPGEEWHGFPDLEEDYVMLDPIKVTVLTPGVETDGSLSPHGIPAALVVRYLGSEGIIVEKSGDYSILFLFSVGITKGKWGTLIARFFRFKELFDADVPLEEIYPGLVREYRERYSGMTIRQLADEMHGFRRVTNQLGLLDKAFSVVPEAVMTPAEAYRKLVRNEVEKVSLEKAEGRILATGIIPYPPGIPLIMGGERAGEAGGPLLTYLKTLRDFDRKFPGFGHEIHGIENTGGEYYMFVVAE